MDPEIGGRRHAPSPSSPADRLRARSVDWVNKHNRRSVERVVTEAILAIQAAAREEASGPAAEVRLAARGVPHGIVPMDVVGDEFFADGWCFLCGRIIYETGDYRGKRYRHGPKVVA